MAVFLEEKNREWLSVIRSWVDDLKDDKLQVGGVDGSLSDFKRREHELKEHLKSLSTWLANNVSFV